MFDDGDKVLSQHDPPPEKDWVVTATGHLTDVEQFIESVIDTFVELKPEISLDGLNEDEVKATIKMVWNSNGLELLLESLVPNHVRMYQKREVTPCQDTTT